MKDLASMSPVARATYLEHENAALEDGLAQAARQIFRLKQEVTGSLQIIWVLAKKNGGTLTIAARDLITAMGAVQRRHNVETDEYTFVALDPTSEQLRRLEGVLEDQQQTEEAPSIVTPATGGDVS